MAGHDHASIAIMRPLLPRAEALLPFLREIDANRVYSNFGPLAERLQRRLEAHWGLADDTVLALSNATSGLSVALMAAGAGRGGLCLMPAWTFPASGQAALACGLTPFLVDVDHATGALTPALAEAALAHAPMPVAAVMPVCPFGAPIDWHGWQRFRERTGIPVVIDAAAAFDSLRPSELPAVVSLHATKILGAGEGALLVCADRALVTEARRRANFGFLGERISRSPSLNAKMSEYHAAVALAALDAWPEARREWLAVFAMLRRHVVAVDWPDGLGRDYVSATACVRVADGAAAAMAALQAEGVESRRWWQDGLQGHPAFDHCPRTALDATLRLAAATLGLPCWRGLDEDAAIRIGRALAGTLQPSRRA